MKIKFGKTQDSLEPVLVLMGEESLQYKEALLTLGFKFDPRKQYWTNSTFNRHTFDYLKIIDPDIEISNKTLNQYKNCIGKPISIFENKLKSEMLLPHQEEALYFLQNAGSGLLAIDIGCGKTFSSLSYAEDLGLNTLVVCPAKLRRQWQEEIKKFTNGSPAIRVDGPRSERKTIWEGIQDYHYAIISYEAFLNQYDIDYIKDYTKNGLIIFDEVTKLKNHKSKTYKAAFKVRQGAKHVVALSARPLENGLVDLYAIIKLVSPGYVPDYETFARNFLKRSEHEFFNPHTGHKIRYNSIDGEKNVDMFKKMLLPIMIKKTRQEVLNLPPESTITYDIELTKGQIEIEDILRSLAKMYPEYILKWFIFAMENLIHPCLINVGAIATTAPFEAYEIQSRINESLTPRLDSILEILEEIDGQKIIIFSKYVQALELIQKKILIPQGIGYKEVSGRVRHPEAELTSFKSDSKDNVLCMTQAGQYGLNITEAPLLIIVDKPLNPAKLDQLKGRIHRKGQEKPVTYFELISQSPTEQRIESLLNKKRDISQKMMAREVLL